MSISTILRSALALCALPATAFALGGPAPGAVSAQTCKLPASPGSVRGLADNATVTTFTGEVQYKIPIELPKTANGFAPSLALGYDGSLGNGPIGVGWSLGQPGIARSLRLGVPAYDATDELDVVGLPVTGQLVALPSGEYRVEGQANRYTGRAVAGGFELVDANGTIYTFGETTVGRKASGASTAFWYLEQVKDTGGQTIQYQYHQDRGEVYLDAITWGPMVGSAPAFRADLVYEARTDAVVSYRTGFRVESAQRLAQIKVSSFGAVQRVVRLAYDDGFALTRLHQVMVTSADGTVTLPATTLAYAPAQVGTLTQIPDVTGWALNANGTSLFDVDGDGAMDLLRLTSSGHSYRRNLGGHFDAAVPVPGATGASLSTVRLLDLNGDSGAEMVWQQGSQWNVFQLTGPDAAHRSWTSLGAWAGSQNVALSSVAVADIDGDQLMDVLSVAGSSIQVRFGGTAGLAAPVTLPAIDPVRSYIAPGNAATSFPDINGDGLADAVYLGSTGMYLYLGKGDGHFEKYRDVAYPWTGTVTTAQIRLGDLDRDGLMDVVVVRSGDVSWYRGLANGTLDPTPVQIARPAGTDASVVVAIADANGNGSEDLVWSSDAGMWILDFAGPTSAGMLSAIDNGLGQSQQFGYDASAPLAFAAATAGAPWTTTLPVSVPVATTSSLVLASGEPTRTSRLSVRDGLYDTAERRFIGFAEATRTTPGATTAEDVITLTRFHAGAGSDRELRGQVVFERVLDGTGKIYRETANDVATQVVTGLPDDPRLRRAIINETRESYLEGTTTPIVHRTRFVHDGEGRVIEEDDDGRTDLVGDESITTYLFATPDPAIGVRDKVCEQATLGANRVAVARTRILYGDDTTQLPPCQAGKGWVREEQGFLASENRWVSQKRVSYDAHGNPISSYENGVTHTLGYDAYRQFVVSETVSPVTGQNLTWTLAWDTTLGVPRTLTAPDGTVSVAEHDGVGRVVSIATGAAAPHTYYRYAWSGPRPSTETFAFDGDSAAIPALPASWTPTSGWRHTVDVANSAGEALYHATQLDPTRWVVDSATSRDARGRTIAVTKPFYATASDPRAIAVPTGTPARTIKYDALDRKILETDADGTRRATAYAARTMTVTADLLGPVVTTLDGKDRTIRTQRTVGGVVESLDASYDPAGRLTSYRLQGGKAVHAFTYDTLGRLIAATDPDLGARAMTYDDRGLLTRQTNALGQPVDYRYDGAGRLVGVTSDSGTTTLHYDVPRTAGYGHTATRLAWVEDPVGTVDLGYDAFGHQTQLHRTLLDGTTTVDAVQSDTYSPTGLVRSRSFDDGLALALGYDAAGRATSINSDWVADSLDAAGKPLAEHFGNAVTTAYTRNAMGQATRIRTVHGAAALYDVAVAYNALGIKAITDTDGVGLDHTATFGYDTAGRLTASTLGIAGTQQFRFAFAYDGLQNMIARTVTGPKALGVLAGTYKYAGTAPRQLTSVVDAGGATVGTFTYDAAGRQISDGARTLHYNALSQLIAEDGVGGGTVTYRYGYDGQRAITHDPAGHASYWLTPELFAHDGVRDHYVRVGDRLISRVTRRSSIAAVSSGIATGALAGRLALIGGLGCALVLLAATGRRRRARTAWAGAALAGLTLASCNFTGSLESSEDSLSWTTSAMVYFHAGLGAGPVLATDATGAVFEERRYEPFGAAVDESRGAGAIPVDFRREPINELGKPVDPDTGASYHGARWMASSTARWLTPDPPVYAPDAKFLASPWDLHPYQYVRQNPVKYWDPDGREPQETENRSYSWAGWYVHALDPSTGSTPARIAKGVALTLTGPVVGVLAIEQHAYYEADEMIVTPVVHGVEWAWDKIKPEPIDLRQFVPQPVQVTADLDPQETVDVRYTAESHEDPAPKSAPSPVHHHARHHATRSPTPTPDMTPGTQPTGPFYIQDNHGAPSASEHVQSSSSPCETTCTMM